MEVQIISYFITFIKLKGTWHQHFLTPEIKQY